MDSLYFEDIEIGSRFLAGPRTIVEDDLLRFAEVSGDHHPIHVDSVWASRSPFGQRIAHGPMGIALAIGLFGQIPAFKDSAIAMTDVREWQFRAPIFIGDSLTLSLTVTDKRSTRSGRALIDRHFQLLKQDGSVAQEGHSGMLIARRADKARP